MIAINKWVREIGITPMTAWRYRKRGWLETINVAGRVFVTQEAATRFALRAAAGEFAKTHVHPPAPHHAK